MFGLSEYVSAGHYLTIIAGAIIGSVSFAGSMIAWGKLSGKIKDMSFKGQHIVNLLMLALVLVAAVMSYQYETTYAHLLFYATVALSLYWRSS